MSDPDYRIDYEHLDVVDLMQQVRARIAADPGGEPRFPALQETLQHRLHEYLVLDDEQPYALQRSLGLDNDWNLSPEDLRRSHRGPLGQLIRGVRTIMRPFAKLLANTDLPIFKQFKINTGMAAAVHDLMQDNARQRTQLRQLSARIERLESARGPEAAP